MAALSAAPKAVSWAALSLAQLKGPQMAGMSVDPSADLWVVPMAVS